MITCLSAWGFALSFKGAVRCLGFAPLLGVLGLYHWLYLLSDGSTPIRWVTHRMMVLSYCWVLL